MPECRKCKGTGMARMDSGLRCAICDGWGRVDETPEEIQQIEEQMKVLDQKFGKASEIKQ